jgi:hypothetical protein
VISHDQVSRVTALNLVPYVVFVVNPGIANAYEFIDMFISSTYKPVSVQLSIDKDFTDYSIVQAAAIKQYGKMDGWWYISGFPRTLAGNRLIGKLLFCKLIFDNQDLFYDVKLVKTGYKETVGG